MSTIPGYGGKAARVQTDESTPGLIVLTILGPRGGPQARIALSAKGAAQLATYLNFASITGDNEMTSADGDGQTSTAPPAAEGGAR